MNVNIVMCERLEINDIVMIWRKIVNDINDENIIIIIINVIIIEVLVMKMKLKVLLLLCEIVVLLNTTMVMIEWKYNDNCWMNINGVCNEYYCVCVYYY